MSSRPANRREFLKTAAGQAAAGFAVPYFFTGRAAAETAQAKPKHDRPNLGAVGCGGQGATIAGRARKYGELVAVCDVDEKRAETAQQKLSDGKAEVYGDYRRVLDRSDIDVVTIGTPDHWHAKIAIEALQAGKDVYCEKPLTLTIDEGKLICRAVRQTGRVFQVGTQQRSHGLFAQAVALCRAGRLGKIEHITVAVGGAPPGGPFPQVDPPTTLDWDRWLGQAPAVPYIERRCHYEYRWWYEYSGGKLTDWGAHHVDIAHWVLGADDTGPVSFEGTAEFPVPYDQGYATVDDCYNTARKFRIEAKFAEGATLIITDRTPEFDNGVLIEGTEGRIFVNRGKLTGQPVDELKENPLPEDALTELYQGQEHGDHMHNFFECVETREQPISDVFSHHRAITTCHLANICIRLGRPLRWDPHAEQIVGDAEANAWQQREPRQGYEIVM